MVEMHYRKRMQITTKSLKSHDTWRAQLKDSNRKCLLSTFSCKTFLYAKDFQKDLCMSEKKKEKGFKYPYQAIRQESFAK